MTARHPTREADVGARAVPTDRGGTGRSCRPACPPPSETSVVQKQDHFLRGFPRLVDDLGFRRLAQAQQHLVEDAGLQQSGKHLGCGALVAYPPALALCPKIEIAGELRATGAGRLFVLAPTKFGEAGCSAGNDAV